MPRVSSAVPAERPARLPVGVSLKAGKRQIANDYGRLPLTFEVNQGQSAADVKFLSRGSGYTLFLTGDEAVLSLRNASAGSSATSSAGANAMLRLRLPGANFGAKVVGLDELPGKSNYFIGNDPKKWRTNVPNYAKVKYENVYPGVDLVYYGNQGRLEYDFVVAPGADPASIRFALASSTPVRVDGDGALVIKTDTGEVRLLKPVVYQSSPTAGRIDGRYLVRSKNQVSFEIASYDHSKPLIIDPQLIYSSPLGYTSYPGPQIAVDSAGSAYVAGSTTATDFPTPYPTTPGAFQTTPSDPGYLIFVSKLNPSGSALVYSTYLGGTGDQNWNPPTVGIAVDATGSAYVTGYTRSTTFPTTTSAFQKALGGGYDRFVSKLDPSGSALVYSTYLGGSDDEDVNPSLSAIALDTAGNAYLTGYTMSFDFPITPGALQTTKSGSEDVFVTKLNASGSAVVYSTFLGGTCFDWGYGIAVDTSGNAYIDGLSGCDVLTGGVSGAFVAKLNPTGTALVYLFSMPDGVAGPIAIDPAGNAYVAGLRYNIGFPATAGALQTQYGGANDGFVTKLNPAGSALVYATYLGGPGDDSAFGIAADAAGNAYVAGWAGPGFPITEGDPQGSGFVAELNPSGTALVYSRYIDIRAWAMAMDTAGNLYVAGGTDPAYVEKLGAVSGPAVTLNPRSLTFGGQPIGTASVPESIIVASAGTQALAISNIVLEGANAGDFSQHHNCPLNMSIPAGGSCIIAVTFTPTAAGSRNASIAITDDSSASPHNVPLTGTGLTPAPGISFSVGSLAFGSQTLGTTSLPKTLTVTSTGAAALTILSIGTTGTNSSDFSVTNNCPISPAKLAIGGNCTVLVTFKPSALGLRGGGVTLTDDAPGSPHVISLTGYGIGPLVTLSSTSYSFGSQIVGTTSMARTALLTNTGNQPMTISSIAVAGPNAADFPERSNCPISPATLAAGANCAIMMSFRPTAAGARSASVVITDNASGSPHAIGLTGTGTTRPNLSAQITGRTKDGTLLTLKISFKNTGSETARNIRMQQVTLRTLTGNGNVTYVGPTLPLNMGDIPVGSTSSYNLQVNVPAAVTKFSVTEAGTFQDAASKSYSFSLGQVVLP